MGLNWLWCGICAKYLTFGTYPTSTVGALTGENSTIRKHHFYLTEEILKANPKICTYNAPHLLMQAKTWWFLGYQSLAKKQHWKLSKNGANSSQRTPAFSTSACVDMPGANFQLTKLLGLNPNINRFMIYQQGYYASGTCLRLAKDHAENNVDAQVLMVCAEITTMFFPMKHGCVFEFE